MDVVEKKNEIKVDMSAYKRSKRKVWISAAIVAGIVAAVFIVGSLLLLGNALIGICAALISIAVLLAVWVPGELKRIRRNFCQECGARYDYQTCVEWEVGEIEIKDKKTNPNSDRKQIEGIRIEHVDFTCTCAKCGNVASFTQKYQTGEVYDDGSVKERNVDAVIKKYFKV
ncbi:MAG: hypothetical protein E7644_00370 [Ruminococcaceae bacterium]|nr:hypothetical protein [Oscillospiraceae bacterium]